jgi:phosphatidylserine/phosphatidylglycerophosphate/cardiolipin synthase-like enzyme
MNAVLKNALVLFSVVFYTSFSVAADLELITLPDQGVQSVLHVLDRAKTNLKISMFHLSQKALVDKIIDLGVKGVKVQIILDNDILEKPSATAIANRIESSIGGKNIEIRPSTKGFSLTHTKALLIDDTQLMISTINFSNAISYSRDFGVITTDVEDVNEFSEVFENDWKLSGTDQNTTPALSSTNLVWSPVNAKSKLVKLIYRAKKTLDVQVENLGSHDIQTAIKAAIKRGVQVRIVMSACADGTGDRNWPFMDDLAQAGAEIKVMEGTRDSLHPYIHAKILLVDEKEFFLGSENFSRNSLDFAREVGIIAKSDSVVSSMDQTFETDWANATLWKNATRKCEPYKFPAPHTD